MKELVNVKDKTRDNLFKAILDYESHYNIHTIMSNNRNHLTRGLYCDLMVSIYNTEEGEFKEIATIALIKGLEDPNEVIKKKLLFFWSDPTRLSPNPSQRLLNLMNYKSKFGDEKTWLQSTVWLLLDLIRVNQDNETSTLNLTNKKSSVKKLMKKDTIEPKEETKSPFKESQELSFENSIHQASFGHTLELSSSFQNSRFYKVCLKKFLIYFYSLTKRIHS